MQIYEAPVESLGKFAPFFFSFAQRIHNASPALKVSAPPQFRSHVAAFVPQAGGVCLWGSVGSDPSRARRKSKFFSPHALSFPPSRLFARFLQVLASRIQDSLSLARSLLLHSGLSRSLLLAFRIQDSLACSSFAFRILSLTFRIRSSSSLLAPRLHSLLLVFTPCSSSSLLAPRLHSSLLVFTPRSSSSLLAPRLHSSLLSFDPHSSSSLLTPRLHSSLLVFTPCSLSSLLARCLCSSLLSFDPRSSDRLCSSLLRLSLLLAPGRCCSLSGPRSSPEGRKSGRKPAAPRTDLSCRHPPRAARS
jgi:hypothetical protein